MGAYQMKQEQQKGSFCFVALYDEDQRQPKTQQTQEEEEDREASSSSLTSASSNSSDTVDDGSSSSSSLNSNEALNDLSELMLNLPIKRGLSKFYQGKSQSFTSMARVTSLEDLAKNSGGCGGYARRMKACKSYGGGLNLKNHQQRSGYTITPKAAISKKSGSSSSCLRKTMNRSKSRLSYVES